MLDYDDCSETVPTRIVSQKIIYRNEMPSSCDNLDVTFGLKLTAEGHRVDWTGVITVSCGMYSVETLCESMSSIITPGDLTDGLIVSLRDMFSLIADVGNVRVEDYLSGVILEWLHDDFDLSTRILHYDYDERLKVEITFCQEGVEHFGFEAAVPMEKLLPDEEGLRKADATAAFLAGHGL